MCSSDISQVLVQVLESRGVEHRFFDITENLTLLIFFAPAEGSQTA
jgi:hypothetical protein